MKTTFQSLAVLFLTLIAVNAAPLPAPQLGGSGPGDIMGSIAQKYCTPGQKDNGSCAMWNSVSGPSSGSDSATPSGPSAGTAGPMDSIVSNGASGLGNTAAGKAGSTADNGLKMPSLL
ncbi:hypothetical protein BDQ17DRAFT_1370723 [Cyathus striatus]|nr:hypothetical protein BDQ17DRAFT_1378689 [Cyathus striatus]KAF8991476.1 hypothetical protein BDQ17DRAFT_1370723 [Cyathus striatus]